jgi:hypothetical protein
LPVKVLSRVFRGKFVDGLKRAFQKGELVFPGALQPLVQDKAFRAFLRSLYRHDWVVYAKRPFAGPQHVLQYLARYTHRVAISNHRLIDFTDGKVTFRWKDYAHGNKKRKMTLTADEFLRRFLLHTLPRGFVRIRFFGFLANRRRAVLLPRCRQLLNANRQQPRWMSQSATQTGRIAVWLCPQCGGPMVVVERLTAQQIRWESTRKATFVDTS